MIPNLPDMILPKPAEAGPALPKAPAALRMDTGDAALQGLETREGFATALAVFQRPEPEPWPLTRVEIRPSDFSSSQPLDEVSPEQPQEPAALVEDAPLAVPILPSATPPIGRELRIAPAMSSGKVLPNLGKSVPSQEAPVITALPATERASGKTPNELSRAVETDRPELDGPDRLAPVNANSARAAVTAEPQTEPVRPDQAKPDANAKTTREQPAPPITTTQLQQVNAVGPVEIAVKGLSLPIPILAKPMLAAPNDEAKPTARDLANKIGSPKTAPIDAVSDIDRLAPNDRKVSAQVPSPTPSAQLALPIEQSNQPSQQQSATIAAAPQTNVTTSIQTDTMRADPRLTPQVEQAIEQLTNARETVRTSRPEILMRHGDFGVVTMRLEASGSDVRATLAARDPGFVPAVQAALNERAVLAPQESTGASNQRGQDQAPGQNPTGQFEQRYGSSPGSSQGSSQPQSGHQDDAARDTEPRVHSGPDDGPSQADGAGGVFA